MSMQLNAIAILVADIKRAVAFYAELGLKFTGPDATHKDVELPNGMRIMLDQHDSVMELIPSWKPPTDSARVAFAFECDSPAEVDSKFKKLTASGAEVVKEPYDAPWGQRYATLHDPDGNLIDLYAPQ